MCSYADRWAGLLTVIAAAATITTPTSAPEPAKGRPRNARVAPSLSRREPAEAYFVGDWEFTSETREYGRAHGFWSVMQLDAQYTLDRFSLVDERGRVIACSARLRTYDSSDQRWELSSLDWGGIENVGSARCVGRQVRVEMRVDAPRSTPSTWRIRYQDLRRAYFAWVADRSPNGGRVWWNDHLSTKGYRVDHPAPPELSESSFVLLSHRRLYGEPEAD